MNPLADLAFYIECTFTVLLCINLRHSYFAVTENLHRRVEPKLAPDLCTAGVTQLIGRPVSHPRLYGGSRDCSTVCRDVVDDPWS